MHSISELESTSSGELESEENYLHLTIKSNLNRVSWLFYQQQINQIRELESEAKIMCS